MIMVPIEQQTSLFLIRMNSKGEVEFRSSLNPPKLQKDKPLIKDGVCYLGQYKFPEEYLTKLKQLK